MAARNTLFETQNGVSQARAIGRHGFAIVLGLTLSTTVARADGIFGTWMRDDQAARVIVAQCGTSICATNVWIRDPDKQNENVGDRLVFTIRRQGEAWSGTGYDPKRDVSFSARLEASSNAMTTRGCMFGGLVCKTTIWQRQ